VRLRICLVSNAAVVYPSMRLYKLGRLLESFQGHSMPKLTRAQLSQMTESGEAEGSQAIFEVLIVADADGTEPLESGEQVFAQAVCLIPAA
jgi:hypothetical protein